MLKAFALNHNSNAAQIIGSGIQKSKYCGRKTKYWFLAILYNSTLTLKAFLGSLTILKECIVNVFKHNLVFLSLEKEHSFLV